MPYHIDLFAVFILLGVVQAIFLSFFFLSRENRKNDVNFFQGLMLLSMAACILEIFLMYTGYIVDCLFLVDFSEPFALAIGPSFYLMIRSLIHGSVSRKMQLVHYIFPVVYFFLLIPFLIQSNDFKYNSWVYAYHPNLPFRDVSVGYDPRWLWVTDHHTLMSLVSIGIYFLFGLVEVIRAFKEKRESFFAPVHSVLKKLRSGILHMTSATVIIFVVKYLNIDDTGDHLFAAYISFTIYLTSFNVISHSGFFRQVALSEPQKYKSSGVTADAQKELLDKLAMLMTRDKPFLQSGFSLPELAGKLNTTVHVLSQVINDGLGKSFFEMVAEYRVEEAKRLLKEQPHVKVEEIAEQVGYNSKSSFNTAFKKISGKTPSEFRSA
ncbi:helix-turn-helix domain-containing protein [Ohtaekwangia kribbensis]|jgi:AraC-like DNA-binding protein|uniref:Helix-turn-helix domain-containing protein n=1 Tax=Ohtaekwangia kribbensis TaxID=688913 RepID=A0ABW3K622_9BACT